MALDNGATNFGESIAVEEQEWGTAVTLAQDFNRFRPRKRFAVAFAPFSATRLLSFCVNASLRSASFAGSAIDLVTESQSQFLRKSARLCSGD